jgi:hypothetical protein
LELVHGVCGAVDHLALDVERALVAELTEAAVDLNTDGRGPRYKRYRRNAVPADLDQIIKGAQRNSQSSTQRKLGTLGVQRGRA